MAKKATTPKPSSIDDLMRAATGLATTISKTEKSKDDNDRPSMALDSETENLFVEFASLNTVFKDLEEHNKSLKTQVNDRLFEKWKDLVWKSKKIIDNPSLTSFKNTLKDITAIFMVFVKKDSLKYDPTEDSAFENNPAETSIKMFEKVGLSSEIARKLVENELIFITHTYVPFDELAVGTYKNDQMTPSSPEEQEVARKILTYLMGNPDKPSESGMITVEALSPDERRIALRQKVDVKVKDGFFQRFLTYCANRRDMDIILSIIRPVFYVGHVKFGVSDTSAERLDRMVNLVRDFFAQREEGKKGR